MQAPETPVKLGWSLLKRGEGNSFCTHVIKIKKQKAKVRRTVSYFLFVNFFYGVGLLALLVFLPLNLYSGSLEGALFMLLFGSLFFGVAHLLFGNQKLFQFDKNRGLYSYNNQFKKLNPTAVAEVFPIEEIAGLQILKEWISGSGSSSNRPAKSYYSYELNLVRKNMERINIMDHGDLPSIERSAKDLADFLGVPVWSKVDSI